MKSKLDFYPLEGNAFKLNVLPQYVAQENGVSSLYLTVSDAFAQAPRASLTGVLVRGGQTAGEPEFHSAGAFMDLDGSGEA